MFGLFGFCLFFFKQKTAYEMRISDWSSDVCSSDLRTANTAWHPEDRLEIHPADAENRGIKHDDWICLRSRAGETTLRALITERVAPGVVYTTFHHPETQANVITTDYSDWATTCPERSEEHTSELQSLMRNSYAVFSSKKKTT